MKPVDIDKLMSEKDLKKRYFDAKDSFNERKVEIANNVKDIIRERGLRQIDLADKIGMSASTMNRSIKPRSGKFGISLARISEFAFYGLGMSAHEMLFGIKEPTRLPRHLSVIVQQIMCDAEKKFQALRHISEEIWCNEREELWRKEGHSALNSTGYTILDLVADRLTEVTEDRYLTASLLLGENMPSSYRKSLRIAAQKNEGAEGRQLTTNTIMFTAMCLYTTVDYFTSVDYTKYTDVKLYSPDEEGNAIVVGDRDIIQLLSYYLRLTKEGQSEAYRYLLRLLWD